MQNQTLKITLAMIGTAIVVGGGVYIWQKSANIEAPRIEAPRIVAAEACYGTYVQTIVANNRTYHVSFEYPCKWEMRNPGNGIVITSPDQRTTVTYPEGDFGLENAELTKTTSISSPSGTLTRSFYVTGGAAFELIKGLEPVAAEGYDAFRVQYADGVPNAEVDHLLSTVSIQEIK